MLHDATLKTSGSAVLGMIGVEFCPAPTTVRWLPVSAALGTAAAHGQQLQALPDAGAYYRYQYFEYRLVWP